MTNCIRSSRPGILHLTARCRLLVAVSIACGSWLTTTIEDDGRPLRAAEIDAADGAHSPLLYRRIFVPADKVDAWPRDGQKYIPVESRDFDTWVAAANKNSSARVAAAIITEAEYSARLENDGRIHGRGQWTITVRGDHPAFLPLHRMSLIVREPHWQNAAQQPVRLGVWGNAEGEPVSLGLEVSRSGVLEFEWHTKSQPLQDEIEVPWRLPTATSTHVTLDLPDGKVPRIDGAVVIESTQMPPDVAEGKLRRRWVLAVSPPLATALRITNSDSEAVSVAPELAIRDEASYRIEQRGLEITATWQLTGPINKQRELVVPLPRGVQLVSAVAEGHQLDWHVVRGVSPASDKAIFALPSAGDSRSLQVVLSAWQPLVLDRSWQLPNLRPAGVFWSSGKIELSVTAEFELHSLNPTDCLQTGVSQVGSGAIGPEIYWLSPDSPTAAIEISIARRQPDAAIRIGSSLALADPDVTGRLVTEWSVARSSLHRLSGELAAGWLVETVETIPADALADWFIDRRGDRRRIEIQLSHAASPARNVSVIIAGRFQRFSLAEPISADTLRMVQWAGPRVARHLLTFQSTEPLAVEAVGNLSVSAPESIADSDRALLDPVTDNGTIFDLTRAGKDAGLRLIAIHGQYAADIELEATYADHQLRQIYRLTTRPKSNPVDRVLVYSTAPLGDNVRWTEKGSDAPIASERMPLNDPQRADMPKEGELWLLRLPQPTSKPIEVSATVTAAWPKRAAVPLVSLPEAVEQRGRISVRSGLGITPAVEHEGLQSIPLSEDVYDAGQPDKLPPIRAAFRFNPMDCLEPSRAPRLWIGPSAESETSKVVARHLELESFFWSDGRETHRATYRLENQVAAEFNPGLPPDARSTSVAINGQPLEPFAPSDDGPPRTIRLPPDARSATVSVFFETERPALSAGSTISPPLLQNGVPFLAGQWTVWLPEEYSVKGADRTTDTEYNWRQRVFGPLARSGESRPFNPIRPADWAHLVNGAFDWRNVTTPSQSSRAAPQQDRRGERSLTASFNANTAKPTMDSTHPLDSAISEAASEKDGLEATLPGWHVYRESFVADGPAPLVILHPSATTTWVVAVLLSGFVLGSWLCHRRGVLLTLVLAIAASLALLLPEVFAPIAAGALTGLSLAILAEWPRRSMAAEDAVTQPRQRIALAGALAVIVVIGLTKLSLAEPVEEQTPATTQSSSTPIERLLIPMDAEGRPSGTKYYLSEQFLRTLLSSGSQQALVGQWLLQDAAYTGELRENADRPGITAGNWTMTFSIETLARDTTVELPLIRDEATWQPTAMLDGIPVSLTWRRGGRNCAVAIAEPGKYSLAIDCVPKTSHADGRSRINLTIPPLSGASVQLQFPATLTGVEASNATRSPSANGAAGVLSGELDNADHLNIQWPRSETNGNNSQGLSVTEVNWLQIGAAGVELETKYIVEGGARRPEFLTIAYDDRWKLLTKTSAPTGEHRDESARQRSIQIPLPSEDIDRQEVSVRWRTLDVPLPGNLRLTPVQLTSIPTTQRWLAVSTDPALDCKVDDDTASAGTMNEFFGVWGNFAAAAMPQVVLANFDPAHTWNLSIRPRETESKMHEVLHVAVGSDSLRIAYQANVVPGNRGKYQCRLTVPKNLSIDEISVTQADRSIPVRWTRNSDNQVNLFFGEEASTDYRIALIGRIPLDAKKTFPLPRIAASSLNSATQQVQLYRDDDVSVDVKGLTSTDESKAGPSDPPPAQWVVRPIGIYQLDASAAASARIVVSKNRLKTAGDTLTTLSREAGAWSASFRCHLVVEQGELDVLKLRSPSTWTGPFEIDSNVAATIESIPVDTHSADLAIRFASTIATGGNVKFQIRGQLRPQAASPISVPNIVPEPVPRGHRYIMLPDSFDSQPITWTEVGVQQANVPPDLLPALSKSANVKQMQITQDPFHVAVHRQSTPQAAARIRLADTAVAVGQRGGQLIVTRLIVAPNGLSECTVQLPADQKLLSVTLDSQPALARPLDTTRWQITLGAAQLPQSLEIISRSLGDGKEEPLSELRRPALLVGGKPIPVEVSLWSFAESGQSTRRRVESAAPVSVIDQAALRFDRLVSIAEAAISAAAELPPPDGYNWFRSWAKLLNKVEAQTRQIMAQPATVPTIAQVSRASEEQVNRASKRLEELRKQCNELITKPAAPQSPERITATEFSLESAPMSPDAGEATYYVAEGGSDRLHIEMLPSTATTAHTQLIGLLLIAGLTITSVWLLHSPAAADFVCRWPHAVGILLGIAWWAWLRPSWVGLLIAAASLWLAVRFAWPGRSLRAEGSTMLSPNSGSGSHKTTDE